MGARLLVDVGQSGIRMFLDGRQLRGYPGVPVDARAEDHLRDIVTDTLRRHTATVSQVAAGVSGLQSHRVNADRLLQRWRPYGVCEVAVCDDSVSGYLGARGLQPGVTLAVGTGVVCLAVGADGRIARADGWGHLIGDEGSGYWIGRAGLTAAMRAFDGRGAATRLLEDSTDWFGPPADLGLRLQRDPAQVDTIASFARTVIAAADEDPVAASICADAVRRLADAAHAASRRTAPPGTQVPVTWAGAVLESSNRLRHLLATELARRGTQLRLVEPRGRPIDGVRQLLALPSAHPLTTLVDRAKTSEVERDAQPR